MGNGSDKPPGLPNRAPKGLKKFVACTADKVEVDT